MRHSSCGIECWTLCPVCLLLLFQSQQVSRSETLRKTFICYNFCLSHQQKAKVQKVHTGVALLWNALCFYSEKQRCWNISPTWTKCSISVVLCLQSKKCSNSYFPDLDFCLAHLFLCLFACLFVCLFVPRTVCTKVRSFIQIRKHKVSGGDENRENRRI